MVEILKNFDMVEFLQMLINSHHGSSFDIFLSTVDDMLPQFNLASCDIQLPLICPTYLLF